MNIEQINVVLNKAILGLQESEIEVITERAMAGAYAVPSPSDVAKKSYKPPAPSAFGELKDPLANPDNIDENEFFTEVLSKRLKKLKKEVKGVTSVLQRYKGTGNKRDQRMIEIRFSGLDKFEFYVTMDWMEIRFKMPGAAYAIERFSLRKNPSVDVAYVWIRGQLKTFLKRRGNENVESSVKMKVKKITVAGTKRALEKKSFSLYSENHDWEMRRVEISPGINVYEWKKNVGKGRQAKTYSVKAYQGEAAARHWETSEKMPLKQAVAWASEYAPEAAVYVAEEE